MGRIRYNGLRATLGASLTNSDTTITFAAALTHSGGVAVPTLAAGDYIPLVLLDSAGVKEVVHLTAYTAAATTGTIARGKELTTAAAHSNGASVVQAPLVGDRAAALLDVRDPDFDFASGYTGLSLQGYVSGDLAISSDGRLSVPVAKAAGNYLYVTPPAGDWVATMKAAVLVTSGSIMFGLIALDASAGLGGGWYNASPDGPVINTLPASGIYSAGFNQGATPAGSTVSKTGLDCWYRLRKVGSTYYSALSLNGRFWYDEINRAGPSTPTKVGFGAYLGTPAAFDVDFFDIT